MRKNGFTMVELLLVIGLTIVVGSMSAIFYSRFLIQTAVLNAVDQVAGQMRKAQTYAMAGKQNGNWGVSFTAPTLILYSGDSYALRNSVFDEEFRVNSNVSISGLTDVNFGRMTGLPGAAAVIVGSGGNNSQTISINSQGTVDR